MNFLSSNIRFLRKRLKLSQQQLADDLGVKRSNIAAYETKNVEPRLSLINRMAQYFSVALEDIIITDLSTVDFSGKGGGLSGVSALSDSSLEEIKEVSDKIQQMLDGFKVFYEFKRETNENTKAGTDGDIENFLVFISHMSEYNRLIENSLNPDAVQAEDGINDAQPADNMVFAEK